MFTFRCLTWREHECVAQCPEADRDHEFSLAPAHLGQLADPDWYAVVRSAGYGRLEVGRDRAAVRIPDAGANGASRGGSG